MLIIAAAAVIFLPRLLNGEDAASAGDKLVTGEPTEKDLKELNAYLLQQAEEVSSDLAVSVTSDIVEMMTEDPEITSMCNIASRIIGILKPETAKLMFSENNELLTSVSGAYTSAFGINVTAASSIMSDWGVMSAPGALQNNSALVILNYDGATSFVRFSVND